MDAFITFLRHTTAKVRYVLHKKLRQSYRISHKTVEFSCLLIGAALVSLFSLGFAKLADLGLAWNAYWTQRYPLAVWFVLPSGLALLTWFVAKYTPYVGGSGIPQVIASISLPNHADKHRLVAFGQTLWKIPLTFLAMLIGASVGREGPSVQVGAAVMLWWGSICRRYGIAFNGLTANELMATGAAGGLAAAFNAPLAGVIFAIEELGRGVLLRWERRVLLGVLAAGFILVASTATTLTFRNITCHRYSLPIFMGLAVRLSRRLFPAVSSPFYWQKALPTHCLLFSVMEFIATQLLPLLFRSNFDRSWCLHSRTNLRHRLSCCYPSFGRRGATTRYRYREIIRHSGLLLDGYRRGNFHTILNHRCRLRRTSGLLQRRFNRPTVSCVALHGGLFSRCHPITGHRQRHRNGNDGLPTGAYLAIDLLSDFLHYSRQFSPKPFYHFAAGRFRHRIQEEIQKNRKEKFIKNAPKSTALLSRPLCRRPYVGLDNAPLPLFSSPIFPPRLALHGNGDCTGHHSRQI